MDPKETAINRTGLVLLIVAATLVLLTLYVASGPIKTEDGELAESHCLTPSEKRIIEEAVREVLKDSESARFKLGCRVAPEEAKARADALLNAHEGKFYAAIEAQKRAPAGEAFKALKTVMEARAENQRFFKDYIAAREWYLGVLSGMKERLLLGFEEENEIYCGRVNAKNAFGGYVGYVQFMVAVALVEGRIGSAYIVAIDSEDGDKADSHLMKPPCELLGYSD